MGFCFQILPLPSVSNQSTTKDKKKGRERQRIVKSVRGYQSVTDDRNKIMNNSQRCTVVVAIEKEEGKGKSN